MEDVVNVVSASDGDINDSVEESSSATEKDKGKSSVSRKGGDVDKVRMSVSNPSLVGGLKVLENHTFEMARPSKLSVGSQRRMEEGVLKEVTNKLEPGPIKLKPVWDGPRISSGSATRDNGLIKKKNFEVGHTAIDNGPKRGISSNMKSSPYSPLLPNPTQYGDKEGALGSPQIEITESEESRGLDAK